MIKSCDALIDENKEYTKHMGFKVAEKEKTLPIMYCIFKTDKDPIGASFITASKIWSTKQVSKSASNIFKPINSQIENFHKIAKFLPHKTLVKTLIIHSLIKTNEKSVPNLLEHTSFRHYKLKSKLSSADDFAFKVESKTFITLSNSGTAHRWKKTKGRFGFIKVSLKTVIIQLTENGYPNAENVKMKQPMEMDPAPFCSNLFLYSYEQEYMSSLILSDKIKARRFHWIKCFTDDPCIISDGDEFGRSFCDI